MYRVALNTAITLYRKSKRRIKTQDYESVIFKIKAEEYDETEEQQLKLMYKAVKQLGKWRSEEHAIFVGTNTVIADDPKLNVRSWIGNNPVRIVLDKNLRISKKANVFDGSVKTILLTEARIEKHKSRHNLIFEEIDFSNNIAKQICDVLQKHQIQSVIIEGGAQTLQTFIDENLWDEVKIFVGENEFKNGVKAPKISGRLISESTMRGDVLKILIND
jgi:diaminohydroxyphosphoribosylaminopyrimidine deaminase/5-amino-6-(5-phosphoribosylamino)uracil reductase